MSFNHFGPLQFLERCVATFLNQMDLQESVSVSETWCGAGQWFAYNTIHKSPQIFGATNLTQILSAVTQAIAACWKAKWFFTQNAVCLRFGGLARFFVEEKPLSNREEANRLATVLCLTDESSTGICSDYNLEA